VKKYNPKAVFSIYFSVVRMEKVAKSGYIRIPPIFSLVIFSLRVYTGLTSNRDSILLSLRESFPADA
ncbi:MULTISPECIES: hypothetical protein, partial [Oscillospiraceae]|uniref:hypothetical protein n=1 Tax=Oscillospiraceae TaxID=216572 RepID=UPI001A9ABF35